MTKKYNEIEVKNNMDVTTNEEVEVQTNEPRKELAKVVTTEPTRVKKTLLGRLITGIAGPEGLPGIGAYVNDEIIKPAIKNIIVDAVTSGINMVMYGEKGGGHRPRYPHSGAPGRSNYRPSTNYSQNYRNAEPERVAVRPARTAVDEYIIGDRQDAAQVLAVLVENADRYDSVSVADYYDLIGIPTQFTHNNYGWSFDAINRASIVPVRGGYTIKFPPTEVI